MSDEERDRVQRRCFGRSSALVHSWPPVTMGTAVLGEGCLGGRSSCARQPCEQWQQEEKGRRGGVQGRGRRRGPCWRSMRGGGNLAAASLPQMARRRCAVLSVPPTLFLSRGGDGDGGSASPPDYAASSSPRLPPPYPRSRPPGCGGWDLGWLGRVGKRWCGHKGEEGSGDGVKAEAAATGRSWDRGNGQG